MKKLLMSVVAVLAMAMPAFAQDATETVSVAAPSAAAPAPQQHSSSASGESASTGGLAIELQGRYSVLNVAGVAGGFAPGVLVPFATLGIRVLDRRLFLGVGVGWYGTKDKDCPGGGAACTTDKTRGFSVTPTIMYDVLVRGFARLYPVGMLNLGRNGTVIPDMGATQKGPFVWGVNVGVGFRGDFNDVVSVGTEWGWGFLRAHDETGGGASETQLAQGAWGTIFVSARIGL